MWAGVVYRPEDLEDVPLRWRSFGLLRGAPEAQDVATTKGVGAVKRDELMRYAKQVLGVGVRTQNKQFCSARDVKGDCKAAQARLCQPSQENELDSSSSGAHLDRVAARQTKHKQQTLDFGRAGPNQSWRRRSRARHLGEQALASCWGSIAG